MRPPRVRRSGLRYPLDEIFGTSALVRLIRVLVHDVSGPVGVADAARMAGLSPAGARKSFLTLERLGVVVRVGTGRAQKFGPKNNNPYMPLFRELFEQEQRDYEALLHELREALGVPEVREAWLRDVPGEFSRSLQIAAVVDAQSVAWIVGELRTRLAETEKRLDVIVDFNVFTRADTPVAPDDAVMLRTSGGGNHSGRPPGVQTRAESTERSLRMAQAVAELIKSDSTLVRRALQHTERLLREGQGTANEDIAEWHQLLETYSPERLRELLVSQSERAERLRRSSPFPAVLTPDERDRMLLRMERER